MPSSHALVCGFLLPFGLLKRTSVVSLMSHHVSTRAPVATLTALNNNNKNNKVGLIVVFGKHGRPIALSALCFKTRMTPSYFHRAGTIVPFEAATTLKGHSLHRNINALSNEMATRIR